MYFHLSISYSDFGQPNLNKIYCNKFQEHFEGQFRINENFLYIVDTIYTNL